MSGETNIFAFLHNITRKGINQEEAHAFIYPDLSRLLAEGKEFPSPEKYVEDLIDFLQTADEDSIRKLSVLAFFMRSHNRFILQISSQKDKSPMHAAVSQFQFHPLLLGGFYENDLRAIQQALQDNEIGQIVKRKLSGFLLEATTKSMDDLNKASEENKQKNIYDLLNTLKSNMQKIKEELDNLSKEFNILKEFDALENNALNSPPVVYQVFSKTPCKDLGVSFASFAHAREFIREARELKSVQDNKDTEEPDFLLWKSRLEVVTS